MEHPYITKPNLGAYSSPTLRISMQAVLFRLCAFNYTVLLNLISLFTVEFLFALSILYWLSVRHCWYSLYMLLWLAACWFHIDYESSYDICGYYNMSIFTQGYIGVSHWFSQTAPFLRFIITHSYNGCFGKSLDKM